MAHHGFQMALIDFILDLAALLLWVNWRSTHLDPLIKSTPATLVGTLRRAEPSRLKRWHFLAAVALLLLFRGWLYWEIGAAVDWTPTLKLGAISIAIRSDLLSRAVLFSMLSFCATLIVFYLWLLFFSVVNSQSEEADPLQKLVRLQLGWVERWPWPIKVLLPLFLVALLWYGLNPLLTHWDIIPPANSAAHRLEQAGAIALGVYLAWKYLITGLLLLYLLNNYVYLGNHAFWNFLTVTGRNILAPLRILPLRLGKLDFAPILAIAVVLIAARFAEHGLTVLYRRLPL
jgi:uncharacterized protein YggT (Ycf19 family)